MTAAGRRQTEKQEIEMNPRHIAKVASACIALLSSSVFAVEPDMPGSKDYPELPRIAGTRIVAYGQSEYDAGLFVQALERGTYDFAMPEGKRTRIVYAGQESQSSLQMIRNYQKAFATFGEYTEIFSCREAACGGHPAQKFAWTAENSVPTITHEVGNMHYYQTYYKNTMYIYGTILKGDIRYHVSVFSVYEVDGSSGIANAPIVHLEILEEEDFEADLVFIDAAAMSTEIAERGSVALYGIQFDFDSAALQASSAETIAEIAKALAADPALNIFVVGHTDSEGDYVYNRELSKNRANSVVAALVGEHGVAAERLSAVGVGSVAPVASNGSDEGRELNRRVAIVKK